MYNLEFYYACVSCLNIQHFALPLWTYEKDSGSKRIHALHFKIYKIKNCKA